MLFSTYNKESLFSTILFVTCTVIELFPYWAEWRELKYNDNKDSNNFKHANSKVFGLFLFCEMKWKGDRQMICHQVIEHLKVSTTRNNNYLNGGDHDALSPSLM